MSHSPAVLFLVFNRPAVTKRTLSAIAQVRPKDLFIAADGPRPTRDGEASQCEEVRSLCRKITWPCNVRYLLQEQNLGCEVAVQTAISWFFEEVTEGVILEDDCLPHPSFFEFSGELLARYRDDERIGTIAGTSRHRPRGLAESYFFSKHFACWGWATWRRVWKNYDYGMALPNGMSDKDVVANFPTVSGEWDVLQYYFDRLRNQQVNTWDFRLLHALWAKSQLSISPRRSMVLNIGFGTDATHTTGFGIGRPRMHEMRFPLIHPSEIKPQVDWDNRLTKKIHRLDISGQLVRILTRLR